MQFSIHKRLLVCAVFLVSTISSPMAEETKPGTLSVMGTGIVKMAPDMAVVSIGVLREEKTARLALDANNKAMAKILEAMSAKGIEDRDLQTSGFNIQPKYVYPKRNADGEQPGPRIVGYSVSNNLTVRIRDIEMTGLILDEMVTLGINTGGNIRFTNSETGNILTQARAAAVKDAIAKAETLTSAANVGLGRIISINENVHSPRPVPIAQARALAVQEDAGNVPIATGENEYRVSVNMSWEIME